jgi:hypothetical protein
MNLGRRRLFGALAVGAACAAVRPAFPMGAPRAVPPDKTPLTPLEHALAALHRHGAQVVFRDVLGMVDFTAPSRLPRFHLVDLIDGSISTCLVAHGRGSDPENSGWVELLSNTPGSNASCAGSFLAGDIYLGKHGRSRRLHGLDPGNSLAAPRGIVIHAADYVDEDRAREQGRVGRSQGCFAVSRGDIDGVLSRLGKGRLLFAWK